MGRVFLCYKPLHPPTGVEHCCFARFTGPQDQNLITAHANLLEIYTLHTLPNGEVVSELTASFTLAARIEALNVLPLPLRPDLPDALLITSRPAKAVLVAYEREAGELVVLDVYSFEHDALGLGSAVRAEPPAVDRLEGINDSAPTVMDPSERCAGMLVYGTQVAIMPFQRDMLAKKVLRLLLGARPDQSSRRRHLFPVRIPPRETLATTLMSAAVHRKGRQGGGKRKRRGQGDEEAGRKGGRPGPGQGQAVAGEGEGHLDLAQGGEGGGEEGGKEGKGNGDAFAEDTVEGSEEEDEEEEVDDDDEEEDDEDPNATADFDFDPTTSSSSASSFPSSLSSKPYILKLREGLGVRGLVKDICFLGGFMQPTLAILHALPPGWGGTVAARAHSGHISVVSCAAGGKATALFHINLLPHDVFKIITPPSGPLESSLLVLSTNAIHFIQDGRVRTVAATNGYASTTVATARQPLQKAEQTGLNCPIALDGARVGFLNSKVALLAVGTGELVGLRLETRGGKVTALRLQKMGGGAGTGVFPSAIAVWRGREGGREGRVFLASRTVDSLLMGFGLSEIEEGKEGGGEKEMEGGGKEGGRRRKMIKSEPGVDGEAMEVEVEEEGGREKGMNGHHPFPTGEEEKEEEEEDEVTEEESEELVLYGHVLEGDSSLAACRRKGGGGGGGGAAGGGEEEIQVDLGSRVSLVILDAWPSLGPLVGSTLAPRVPGSVYTQSQLLGPERLIAENDTGTSSLFLPPSLANPATDDIGKKDKEEEEEEGEEIEHKSNARVKKEGEDGIEGNEEEEEETKPAFLKPPRTTSTGGGGGPGMELMCCAGQGRKGSLIVMRRGLISDTLGRAVLPGPCFDLWCMPPSSFPPSSSSAAGSARGREEEGGGRGGYILLSLPTETVVYHYTRDALLSAAPSSSTLLSPFYLQAPTLALAPIGKEHQGLVQIYGGSSSNPPPPSLPFLPPSLPGGWVGASLRVVWKGRATQEMVLHDEREVGGAGLPAAAAVAAVCVENPFLLLVLTNGSVRVLRLRDADEGEEEGGEEFAVCELGERYEGGGKEGREGGRAAVSPITAATLFRWREGMGLGRRRRKGGRKGEEEEEEEEDSKAAADAVSFLEEAEEGGKDGGEGRMLGEDEEEMVLYGGGRGGESEGGGQQGQVNGEALAMEGEGGRRRQEEQQQQLVMEEGGGEEGWREKGEDEDEDEAEDEDDGVILLSVCRADGTLEILLLPNQQYPLLPPSLPSSDPHLLFSSSRCADGPRVLRNALLFTDMRFRPGRRGGATARAAEAGGMAVGGTEGGVAAYSYPTIKEMSIAVVGPASEEGEGKEGGLEGGMSKAAARILERLCVVLWTSEDDLLVYVARPLTGVTAAAPGGGGAGAGGGGEGGNGVRPLAFSLLRLPHDVITRQPRHAAPAPNRPPLHKRLFPFPSSTPSSPLSSFTAAVGNQRGVFIGGLTPAWILCERGTVKILFAGLRDPYAAPIHFPPSLSKGKGKAVAPPPLPPSLPPHPHVSAFHPFPDAPSGYLIAHNGSQGHACLSLAMADLGKKALRRRGF